MRRLNFATGIFNKLLGTLLVITGIEAVLLLTAGVGLDLDIVTLYNSLGVVPVIVISAILVFAMLFGLYGHKDIVNSTHSVEFSADKKKRGFAVFNNLLLVAVVISALAYFIVKLGVENVLVLRTIDFIVLALDVLVSLVLFVLLFVKNIIVFKKQHVKREKKVKQPKPKKEKRRKKDKVVNNPVAPTEQKVEPTIKFSKKTNNVLGKRK